MPEQVLTEIAAALAAKTAESIYELVRRKFKARKQALDALEAADGASPGSPEVTRLAQELATAEAYDEQFRAQLRTRWKTLNAQSAGAAATNIISGTVKGNAVQAHDIDGDITFGP